MEGLRRFDIMGIAFIGMLFCAGVMEAIGQDVITSTTNFTSVIEATETNQTFVLKANRKDCECIDYNCGCCQHLTWDVVSMDGILCANASYLDKDFGISLTVTFNKFTIINETVSARNPPPICFGEDIVDAVEVEICLRVYDIHIPIKNDKFHACFEILGIIMKLKISKIQLGCIQTKLRKNIEYVENNLSPLFRKKTKKHTPPNVVMV